MPTASFRFHLTMDTLAVQLYISHYLGMFRTFTCESAPMARKRNVRRQTQKLNKMQASQPAILSSHCFLRTNYPPMNHCHSILVLLAKSRDSYCGNTTVRRFESLHCVYGMGDFSGHYESLACFYLMFYAAHGELAGSSRTVTIASPSES